jgi:KaiC/GvpD/RAD55 family RecA-like ATPase
MEPVLRMYAVADVLHFILLADNAGRTLPRSQLTVATRHGAPTLTVRIGRKLWTFRIAQAEGEAARLVVELFNPRTGKHWAIALPATEAGLEAMHEVTHAIGGKYASSLTRPNNARARPPDPADCRNPHAVPRCAVGRRQGVACRSNGQAGWRSRSTRMRCTRSPPRAASNHLLGKHAFEVTQRGVVVYPRLEATATRANAASDASGTPVSCGIPGWDELTGNGLMQGSVTCLLGTPGIGKTLMGLHFIHQGLAGNEQCLVLGFYESPPRLLQKAGKVGIDLAAGLGDGRLDILWHLPLEVLMDRLALDLLENIDRRKVTRLFIDGVEGLRDIAAHRARTRPFLIALINELRVRNVTTFISQELPYFSASYGPSDSSASVLYENILLLKTAEVDGADVRVISAMKMRESASDPARRVMSISGQGIAIGEPLAAHVAALRQQEGVR